MPSWGVSSSELPGPSSASPGTFFKGDMAFTLLTLEWELSDMHSRYSFLCILRWLRRLVVPILEPCHVSSLPHGRVTPSSPVTSQMHSTFLPSLLAGAKRLRYFHTFDGLVPFL